MNPIEHTCALKERPFTVGMGIAALTERIESLDIDSSGMSELSGLLADLNRVKGWVSDEHADALATAAGKLSGEHRAKLFDRGDELARRSAAASPAQFARHLSKLARSIARDDGVERSEQQRQLATLSHGINDDTGLGWVRVDLHPDDYQKFKRKLDVELAALRKQSEHDGGRYDQVAATAFMGLVTITRAAAQPVSEVAVLIDLASLMSGPHPDGTCEYSDGTPLPVVAARRHACNANINHSRCRRCAGDPCQKRGRRRAGNSAIEWTHDSTGNDRVGR